MSHAHAHSVPTVHVLFVDQRALELPGQARCLPVPPSMDRRQPAVAQDDDGRALIYPQVGGGYLPRQTADARPLGGAPHGAEVLVELPREGLWRVVRVTPGPGFLCPAHRVPMRVQDGRLGCGTCDGEPVTAPGEQTPGVYGLTGYAWTIRPLDEAARRVSAGGAEGLRYGYGAGEVEPAHDAEWLYDRPLYGSEAIEHLVVTTGPQAPTVPPGWGIEPLTPMRPAMLSDDPARPVFAVRAAGPATRMLDWTLQSWVYGVGAGP